MIITILAEPRSGSTNLTNWFYFNKNFTTLFEPENPNSKWFQNNIDPKDSNPNDGPVKIIVSKPKRGDNKMISLHDLRSHNAISVLELGIKAKLDQIIKSVLDSYK